MHPTATSSGAGPVDRVDLDGLFASRLRRGIPGPELTGRRARVVFDAPGGGTWTVVVEPTRVSVHRGGDPNPTTTVRGATGVLAGVIDGRLSGVAAFLDGRVTVRGDLALALALDGLFTTGDHLPPRFPRTQHARPLGIRTSYLLAGPADARPVVLLHGLGATNASMLPLLWDLARDHRVFAPDLPGHGASAAPRATYDAGWFARWLAAFQADVGARPAVVVGNSLGGRIALEAGLTDPAGADRLVLLCPSPAFRRLRQWVPIVRLLRPELATLPVRLSHALVVDAIRSMFSVPDRLAPAWYDGAADEFLRVFHTLAGRLAFFSSARQIYLDQAYGERGFWSRLPRLAPPALFVWGQRDRLVPASYARHVVRAVPAARSVVLADCGHVPQFELPEATVSLIRESLV